MTLLEAQTIAAEASAIESYGPTFVDVREGIEFDELREAAVALGAIARSYQWWIGDLLAYGIEHFGEDEWPQLEADLELDPKTAQNYAYVARNVQRVTRRENLSFSHHAEIARLRPVDQEKMLERAAEAEWSVRDLRREVLREFPVAKQDQLEGFEHGPGSPAIVEKLEAVWEDASYLSRRLNEIEGKPTRARKWLDRDVDAARNIVQTLSEISTYAHNG